MVLIRLAAAHTAHTATGSLDAVPQASVVAPSLFAGALWTGLLAGVLHAVLGPDHLSTIVTLSAGQGTKAFWLGARWAAGHVVGLSSVAVLLAALDASGGAAAQAYEHYADYIVGVLLMSFGLYFLLRADEYFDADWRPTHAGCACHTHFNTQPAAGAECKESLKKLDVAHRRAGSVFMGFAQGLACPGGLAGMAILRQFAQSVPRMVAFMATFFVAAALAMGGLATAYGVLTQRCLSSAALARGVHRASCALTIVIGAAWIVLNATGRLDGALGHSHAHGGHHDDVLGGAGASGSLPLALLAVR
mmetsp:Transcript_42821/g.118338  ORF Transcript_42821/g.118338 Transcript_42821/m.118338 type:complete len:305 (+) Transcript_42821:66-980(+)